MILGDNIREPDNPGVDIQTGKCIWRAMFTGLVETTGTVESREEANRAIRLAVRAPGFAQQFAVGDSVSVNGVCLTVVERRENSLGFDVVEETLERSTLGGAQPGTRVNLERPLSLGSLLGGHLVQGHVDAVGTVRSVERRGSEHWIRISAPEAVLRYVVEKGSIAVDGVSLTIAECGPADFAIAVIPHTSEVTTLGECAPGTRVNLEADVVAKHLEKLALPYFGSRK